MIKGGRNIFCILLLFIAYPVCAQPYERMLRRNFWNDGFNAAGIRQDTVSLSDACLYGRWESGDFRYFGQGSGQWTAGAAARTMMHLDRYSMIGSFSFDDTESYDACGSMLAGAGSLFPVDVLEFTPGRKSFQNYSVSGGISADLSSGWRIGAKLDFTSGNASKRKDLRYTSYALDLAFTPSVMYVADGWAAGLSLIYGRNTETVSAEQIGTAQNAPSAFFDKGLLAGNLQAWTGSGIHLDEAGVSGLPLVRNSYGAAFQLESGNVFAELDASFMRGRAGERQTVWYRFSGPHAGMFLGWRSGPHSVRAGADWEYIVNDENVLDKVVEGGVTVTMTYGFNRIYERSELGIFAEYDYIGRVFEIRGRLSGKDVRSISAPMYPYLYMYGLKKAAASVDLLYRWRDFEFGAGIDGSAGMISDGSRMAGDVTVEGDGPYRLQECYDIACEYESAPRAGSRLSVRWNFCGGLYAMLAGDCTRGFLLEYIGGNVRYGAVLKLGYVF